MATGGRQDGLRSSEKQLPVICSYFNSPKGCDRERCAALHICYHFVTSECRYGERCRLTHSLETPGTRNRLFRLGWTPDQYPDLLRMLQMKYAPKNRFTRSLVPSVCFAYNCNSCNNGECPFVHLCYRHVMGRCPGRQCRQTPPLSHSLANAHNAQILTACGLGDVIFTKVISSLRNWPLRPRVCRRYNSNGCTLAGCKQLHCCYYFARGNCTYGARCRHDHHLNSWHNKIVLEFFGLNPFYALSIVREDIETAGIAGVETHPTAPLCPPSGGHMRRSVQQENADQGQEIRNAQVMDERDEALQSFSKMAEINQENEIKLKIAEKEKDAIQVEAEHKTLLAEEQGQFFSKTYEKLLAERDSLERSLLVAAENSFEYENIVTGLNEKLSSLELDFEKTQDERLAQIEERRSLLEEHKKLQDELDQERRKRREEDLARSEQLESTLICSVCLEMFVEATTLGCAHTFCGSCVSSVEQANGLCPMCRAPIRTKTRSITLDEMVSKALETMSEDRRTARQILLNERG
ncbi:E3 ubiquitin-protein ligase rnf8-A-like [Pollicipes pollicipes]|uniref:E3 ubiquitin-protein ligase rnf8-A-like n=1 Tax=Pollicipes pollicipes TaxID=41117 RepID=UPI0018852165|nr:E3 ubiquitin-protein ligase rnf8-A-like [Pollicipes pollicipes]XP_037090425.1 E3 ubiquitin-protein ligase rnf8-A-like [Pollicipes pollicipes]